MTTIAEFTLSAADFPLGRVFEERPEVTLELDRVVPTKDTVMPYFWVQSPEGNLEKVLQIFEELPELRSIILMEDLGERGLFRAEWKPDFLGIMRAISESGVTVISATGSQDGWLFELRAENGGALAAFQSYCDEHAINVSLVRLSHLSELQEGAEYGLTPQQREALLLAYADGYYDSPRGTDLEALSEQFGISRQALSSRLRRGYCNLIEHTLLQGNSNDN